jgi:hypothetical protein
MKKKIGRLAMRHEGTMWNAYYAESDTMEGALLLGSIAMAFVGKDHLDRKLAFMAMMQDAVADLIEEKIGQRPTWPEGAKPAPESERGGHA